MAPARSPERASRSMTRRWPGSSSGSRSTRRRAASIAPDGSPLSLRATANRSSRSPTRRSTRAARAACQSSKSGLSRNAKPARNGPRARAGRGFEILRAIGRREALQLQEIHPRRFGIYRHSRSIDADPGRPDRRSERRQRSPKCAACRLVIGIGPEHGRQLVARERASLGGDQGDDRERLPGIHGDMPPAVERPPAGRAGGSESVGRQRHRVTVPRAIRIP